MVSSVNKGFSLLELMVVISIVSVVVTLSISMSRTLAFNAKMYEAKQNARIASTLLSSYVINEESGYLGLLTANNRSSVGSCLTNNTIGFKVGDCRRVNYVYFAAGGVGGKPNVHAWEGWENIGGVNQTVIFRYTTCSNVWVAANGELYESLPDDNCTRSYQLWKDSFGSTGPLGDYNGSGRVDLADYTIWRNYLGAFSIFP